MLASASMDLVRLIKHGNRLLRPTRGHKSERISPGLSPAVRRSPSPALHIAVRSAQRASPRGRIGPGCSPARRPPLSGMGSGARHIAPACWKIAPGAVHIDVGRCPDHSRVLSRSLSGSDLIDLSMFSPKFLIAAPVSIPYQTSCHLWPVPTTFFIQIRRIRGSHSSENEAPLSS